MNKTAMNKKIPETTNTENIAVNFTENIVFEPIVIHVKDISTSIHLLSCQEENVILAALISLDRYTAKNPSHLDVILQKGLKPKDLLSLTFEKSSLPPSSPVRRFAAKLLTRMVKIPKIRESLPQGASYCLASLQRDDGDPMNEFASNILAELIRGASVSYAASLLISPPLKQDHPIKILFTRLTSTSDPDVIHNCLRNIWQLLIAASAAPKNRHYISEIEEHLNSAALPPLFKSNYPSIQLLSMAVAYEVAICSPENQTTWSTCFPSLLTLLESSSDRLLHRTVLALLRRLIYHQPMKGQTSHDPAIPLVATDGPARLLKYLNLQETEDKESKVAVAAAHAICRLEHHPNALKEIAGSQAPQHLAELAARWPGDESIPLHHRQTFDGCCVAARALELLVRDYPPARTSLTYEASDDSAADRTLAAGTSATSTGQHVSEKVPLALYCLQEVLERVGKLPEECISSVLGTVTTLASDGKLRLALIGMEGFVCAVTNCLNAHSYSPPDPEPPELPVAWPQASDALECLLVARFARESIWEPKNPAAQFSDPPLGIKEAACIALGMLMLESSATEMFVSMKGAEMISRLLKEDESGFGRDSLLKTILFFIANCPMPVANALIRNGTLQWMMKEGASRFTSVASASWHAAIASLLRSNPSAKFQITGCLNPEDDTGNLFYVVCPPPKRYSAFKTIEEYRRMASKPHRHVLVACWSSYKPHAEKDRFYRRRVRKRESFVSKQESHDALDVDMDLLTFEISLKEELKRSRFGVQEMVRAIAQLVWEIMAGPVRDAEFRKERHLEQLKIEIRQGDVIPLGKVRMGGFTERAILFKVLSDRLGLPVALVRGPYGRSWVEISLVEVLEKSKNKEQEYQEEDVSETKGNLPEAKLDIPLSIIRPNHVIDLITKPGCLYPIGSTEANLYCGYELNGSEGRMNSPFNSLEGEDNLESKKKTMKDTENEDDGYKAEDDDDSENEVEIENED